jgi:hypothetical protein
MPQMGPVTRIDPAARTVGGDGTTTGTVWPNLFGNRGYDGPEPPVGGGITGSADKTST